jgi:hypothetical protein
MKKLMVALALAACAATSGCFVEVDEGHRHRHCFGCGHVYVKGYWR